MPLANVPLATPPQRRPNILLVMADQWPAAWLNCYGCPVPGVTPHLDALASRGVRFSRHYANAPVCGPSRATIFSGRSPVAHGVFHNNIAPSPDAPFFTHDLRRAGYSTFGVGKFHFTPMQHFPPRDPRGLDAFGFDEALITEDPRHGPWLDWIRREHPDFYPAALATAWPMPYINAYPPEGHSLREAWRAAYDKYLAPLRRPPHRGIFHPSPLPEELHQTTWITDRAIERIEAHQRNQGEEPFFGFVSYVDPHDPYDPPDSYAALFPWQEMPPPLPQEWSRDWCPRDYARFQDTMFEMASFGAEDWARLRARYTASCRFVDESIGRLLQSLQRSGLDQNTVVVFTTDHGDLLGDHGLVMKGPWHYDKTIRCPLLVSGPGVAHGATCDALSSTLDIAPTLLRLAGLSADLEGRALPLEPQGLEDFSGAEEIVVETNASYVSTRGGCRTLISDDGWRLSIFPHAAGFSPAAGEDYGELFDLRHDSDEGCNLFREPQSLTRRCELAERLITAMARQIYPMPRGELADF